MFYDYHCVKLDNYARTIASPMDDEQNAGMAKLNWTADLEKVEFIIKAAQQRQQALIAGDLVKLREDLFQDINDPVLGTIPIGRSAMAKLDELSFSAISFAGLIGRVAIPTAKRILGPLLVRFVIRDAEPISQKMLQQAYQLTEAAIRPKLTTRTHLLPCHIVEGKEPSSIAIGPVTFFNRSAARALVRDMVRQHIRGKPAWTRQDRRMLAQAIVHYRSYQWIALVKIEDCDPELAANYARSTIILALSGLQLFLGAQASQEMAVGGDFSGWTRTAELKIAPNGEPDVAVTTSYRGGSSFEPGWSADLDESGMKLGLRLLGKALEASLPGVHRPVSNRYLGSLQWYGEAVRDRSPATSLIKFITAIEHLLLTGERDNITDILTKRVAALTYDVGFADSRMVVETNFRRLYDLRSRIVHGAIAPWDESARLQLRAAASVAENVLHSALNLWREEGLLFQSAKLKPIRQWFDMLVGKMIEDTEPVAHVIHWIKLNNQRSN